MNGTTTFSTKLTRRLVPFLLGTVFQFGLIEACDSRLISLTQFIDPCGTVFANCAPGDIQTRNAEIGDFCIDPACTIPGACGFVALGTITDVCP